jgi:hypothetical protein
MLKRYERCIGLSFPAIGRFKIEIWFCPPGYTIREHTHPNEDIKLILLFGHQVKFHRRKKGESDNCSFMARFRHIGRVFTINAGDAHFFEVSKWPLVFMNVEKWKDGVTPTSASDDLHLTSAKENIYARQ